MAGDWIKVEKATARKPEVLRLADLLGIHPDHAFGLCVRFWFWCDDQLADGHAPSVTNVTLNSVVGHAGFAEALAEVGWLNGRGSKIFVPNFDRHLSGNAKKRALSLERKQKERETMSRSERDKSVTREEREESEREILSLKGDRKAIGSSDAERGESRSAARHPSPRSPVNVRDEARQEEPFDLSDVDWDRVVVWADGLGRKVPPRTTDDRRMWFRFAVMADMTFGEAWLADGIEAVLQAKATRTTRQAHLVAVLKAKAAEEHHVDEATFVAMLGRIEIPKAIWKSTVLEIQK